MHLHKRDEILIATSAHERTAGTGSVTKYVVDGRLSVPCRTMGLADAQKTAAEFNLVFPDSGPWRVYALVPVDEGTADPRDARIVELESIVSELHEQTGEFRSQLRAAVEESRAIFMREVTELVEEARAEVPESSQKIIDAVKAWLETEEAALREDTWYNNKRHNDACLELREAVRAYGVKVP